MGCRETMDKRAKADGYANGIDDLLNKKCATAIIEMEAIVQDGVRRGLIDLFLEQGLFDFSIQSAFAKYYAERGSQTIHAWFMAAVSRKMCRCAQFLFENDFVIFLD